MMCGHGGRGSSQKKLLKQRIFAGQLTKKCCFCRKIMTRSIATLEHIKPISEGGGWSIDNLTVSCFECNNERGSQDFLEFRNKKRKLTTNESTATKKKPVEWWEEMDGR